MHQCRAMIDRTSRHPVLKSLFLSEADKGCGTFLGQTHLAAEEMEHSSKEQRESQAKRVRNLLRQGHCLVAPRQPLVRIAKIPQRPTGTAMTHGTSVHPIEERRGTALLRIGERYTLGKVRVCSGYRAQVKQCRP